MKKKVKEKKLRIEDALNATKAAVSEGIVIGGGAGLNTVLTGMKRYTNNLTAIVAVSEYGKEPSNSRKQLGTTLPLEEVKDSIVALSLEKKDELNILDTDVTKTSFGYCFCDCLEEYCSDNNKAELTYEKDGESLKYFCPSYAKYDKDRYKDLYKGILESFEMIQQECRETKDAFWEEENQKREAFYKAQKSEKTAETKEQQFRNRIQSQSDVGKINAEDLANTGEQKKREESKKEDKDDLTQ